MSPTSKHILLTEVLPIALLIIVVAIGIPLAIRYTSHGTPPDLHLADLAKLKVRLDNYALDHAVGKVPRYPETLDTLVKEHYMREVVFRDIANEFAIQYYPPAKNAKKDDTLFVAKGQGYLVSYPITGNPRVDHLEEHAEQAAAQ